MTILESCKLIEKYGKCPNCGCETICNGTGTLEVDTEIGFFKRTCHCGWSVQIEEE
jgi:hypothetical protein